MENLIINGKGISSTYNDGSWKIDANSGAVIIEDIIPHVGDAIAKGESIQVVFNTLFNNILPRIPIIDYANMFKTDENGIDSEYPEVTGLNGNAIYIRVTFVNSNSPLYISCWLLQSDIESLKDMVNSKASKSEYDLLREEVESKVSSIQLEYLQEQINLKADKSNLDRLQTVVDKKANNDYVASLEATIYNKADKTALTDVEQRIDDLNTSLTNYVNVTEHNNLVNIVTDINTNLSNKVDSSELVKLNEQISSKADINDIEDINKKLDDIAGANIDEVNTKLNSITLTVDKLGKKIELNTTDIRKKADLSYVERIDTDLKKATTKLDIIVDTKADKTDLLSKANKSDVDALSNTNVIINNNISQIRKILDTKVDKTVLEARCSELQHSISDLYSVEKNDVRIINSKIANIEKDIDKVESSLTDIAVNSSKEWIQVLTPEQYKRIPSSRIDPAKMYMCIKYGKPYALYIGSTLIAERNIEESTGFAYTFPLTF